MKLTELNEIAKKDLDIHDDLDTYSQKNGKRIAQWSEWLSAMTIDYRRVELQLKRKTQELYHYYYTEYDITLNDKQIRDIYLPGDPAIIDLQGKIEMIKEKMNICERIIRALSQNTFHIKNIIEYRKFMSGVL